MKQNHLIPIWFQQIRGPFLILSIVLVFIGFAAARQAGHTHTLWTILIFTGVVLAHASVNLFNEISDFKTGIDSRTRRTPFSGGSGMMQAGRTSLRSVTVAAYGSLLASAAIGLYLCIASGWILLPFMLAGGLAIRFYTSHLARLMIGELVSGLTLGTSVVLGTYAALTGSLSAEIIYISIPPGILTALLLFLNEFPDAEADATGGRRHLVIHFGRAKSSRIYAGSLVIVYALILAAPLLFQIPVSILLALLTLPLALKAVGIARKHHDDTAALIPALGLNVGVVILTDLLLGVGYLL